MRALSKAEKTNPVAKITASHWRLLAACLVGVVGWGTARALAAPQASHVLIGWDLGAAAYLALTWRLFLKADEKKVRLMAAREDEGRSVILMIVLAAIVASLWAVVDAMIAARTSGSTVKALIAGCAGATLVLSWLVLQSVFVLHYAHRHFGEGDGKDGIGFPGEPASTYMDFVYLAFSIGATFQVSDNAVLTSRLRRLVTAHAATAYFYNTAILALGINIIASVVGG